MSKKVLKLKDYIRVVPNEDIKQLDKELKNKILDSAISGNSRGLLVTFDLSHSAKKINNRIYTPSGQREGVPSWTDPYPKPILIHHDSKSEPIGRFTEVKWVSLESEAINHIGSLADYISFKRIVDSGKPQAIYKQMQKLNLLEDTKWPGMGKLVATARITDKDAIEKFLDGRYLTFSAGSRTNAYHCMVCGSAWHDGDICDHRPGMTDEDGNQGVFMTGTFYGDEGSVVNMPADGSSQVRSMEFTDSVLSAVPNMVCKPQADTIVFADSEFTIEMPDTKTVTIQDLEMLEPETVVKNVASGTLDLVDALKAASHLEIVWLIRIHDALHHQYDYRLEYQEGDQDHPIPADIYKLHGALHELSKEKSFRDSMINGPLDGFDSKGVASTGFMARKPAGKDSLDSLTEDIRLLKEAVMNKLSDLKGEGDKTPEPVRNADETKASSDSTEIKKEETKILDTINWYLLDLALDAEVERSEGVEAKLTTEARDALEESVFCGPDRSFPIGDKAYHTAALRLLDKYDGPGDKAAMLLDLKDRGAKFASKKAPCEGCKNCKCKDYDQLDTDYKTALQQVDEWKVKLETLLTDFAKTQKAVLVDSEDKPELQALVDWFQNHSKKETDTKEPIKPVEVVENPGLAHGDKQPTNKKLGDFEKKLVDNYKQILDTHGQDAADRYLRANRRYLTSDFDLNLFTNN